MSEFPHYDVFISLKIVFTITKVQTLMKFRILQHFIWVFTVCQRTYIGSYSTGAQLCHNDFRIFADRSSRNNSENRKTEKRRNLFNRFMIYKGQTCALII